MNSEMKKDIIKLLNCSYTIENYLLRIIPIKDNYTLREEIDNAMFHIEEAIEQLENM